MPSGSFFSSFNVCNWGVESSGHGSHEFSRMLREWNGASKFTRLRFGLVFLFKLSWANGMPPTNQSTDFVRQIAKPNVTHPMPIYARPKAASQELLPTREKTHPRVSKKQHVAKCQLRQASFSPKQNTSSICRDKSMSGAIGLWCFPRQITRFHRVFLSTAF